MLSNLIKCLSTMKIYRNLKTEKRVFFKVTSADKSTIDIPDPSIRILPDNAFMDLEPGPDRY